MFRISTYEPNELEYLLSKVHDWNFNSTVLLPRGIVENYQNVYVLKEDFLSLNLAILFNSNSNIDVKFNDLITNVIEGGLVKHWSNKKLYSYIKINIQNNKIKLSQFSYFFILPSFLIVFAVFAFIFEISFFYWKKSELGKQYKRFNYICDIVYEFLVD